MNQGDGNTGRDRRSPRGMLSGIAEKARQDEHLTEFVAATVLTLVGLFFCWQAWLILSQETAIKQADAIKTWEIRQLGEEVSRIRARVQQGTDSASVAKILATQTDDALQAAAVALKQDIPELISAEFFRPDLNDVLTSNFAKFGYSKAAMLVQAHRTQSAGPLQSQVGTDKKRVLVLALPAARDKQLAAYVYVQMAMDPLLQVFRQQSPSSVRIDLRQGDGRGDLLLDSIGSDTVSTLNHPGDPIPDSTFRIASAQVELPILVSRQLWLVLTLAIALAPSALLLCARAKQAGSACAASLSCAGSRRSRCWPRCLPKGHRWPRESRRCRPRSQQRARSPRNATLSSTAASSAPTTSAV